MSPAHSQIFYDVKMGVAYLYHCPQWRPEFWKKQLRGVLLVEADEWAKTHQAEISSPGHKFLQTSILWREQRVWWKEKDQRRRELAQTEAQVWASRRLCWLVASLAVMLLLTVGAGLVMVP